MNKEIKFDETISQPLLTNEGYLNPACMNELESAINNMPKTFDRLSGDSEWSNKKDQWTFKSDIIGAFSMWACRQSPYGVPDGLENVCKYLNAALESCGDGWKNCGMQECSLVEINKWLYEILYEQGVEQFDAWNKCKSGNTSDIQFSSRYDGVRNPDTDFIDLDALLHNVCITIRNERRTFKAFNDKFDKQWSENKLTI